MAFLWLEKDDLVFAVILSTAVLCQTLVEHLRMEFAESQFSVVLGCYCELHFVLFFAEETDHAHCPYYRVSL